MSDEKVWYRPDKAPAGSATHVLVIATSLYKYLPADGSKGQLDLRQLDSACRGAAELAIWLRENGQDFLPPIASIRLLLAPSQAEGAAIRAAHPDVPFVRTEGQTVQDTLYAWQRDCQGVAGNLAFLYVAGHGVLAAPGELYVLAHDALRGPDFRNSIGISGIQHALGLGRLGASMVVVDACQDIPENNRLRFPGGDVTLAPPISPQPESRQARPLIYGSQPGRQAFGHVDTGSYLSMALLECLRGRAAVPLDDEWTQWGITTTSLVEEVVACVEELQPLQRAEVGETNRKVQIYRFQVAPQLPLSLDLDPSSLGEVTVARLRDRVGVPVLEPQLATTFSTALACGQYSLELNCLPPPRYDNFSVPVLHGPPRGASKKVPIK